MLGVCDEVHIDTSICVLGFNKKVQKYVVFVDGNDAHPRNMPAIFRGKNWAVIEIMKLEPEETDYQ